MLKECFTYVKYWTLVQFHSFYIFSSFFIKNEEKMYVKRSLLQKGFGKPPQNIYLCKEYNFHSTNVEKATVNVLPAIHLYTPPPMLQRLMLE